MASSSITSRGIFTSNQHEPSVCYDHILDALAKAASGREPMPIGVFTSDQHEPSVHYWELEQASDGPPALGLGADQPSAPSTT